MDLGLEDQEERVLDPKLVNGHLAYIDVLKDVEAMWVDDVAAEGGNNIMRTSQGRLWGWIRLKVMEVLL
jgi:hypothetical protein